MIPHTPPTTSVVVTYKIIDGKVVPISEEVIKDPTRGMQNGNKLETKPVIPYA